MANNRDVKLTIRAKDEASAVMAKVTEALNKYGKGADDLSKKIAPVGAKFKNLTAEVSNLQSTLAKGKGQIAVATQYKVLSDTLSKVIADHKATTAAIAENNAKLTEAKSRLDTITAARDHSRKALAAEKEALREANKEIDQNTKRLADAKTASGKYAAELAKRQALLAGYRADLGKATQAQEQARQSDERAARTATVLKERLADLRAEREAQRRILAGKGGMTDRTERASAIATKTADPWAALAARSYQEDEGAARSKLVAYDAEIARVRALADAANATRTKTQSALAATSATVRAVQADMVKTDNTVSLSRKLAEANGDIAKYSAGLDKASANSERLGASIATLEDDVYQLNAATQTTANSIQQLESAGRKLDSSLNSATSTITAVDAAMAEMNAEANSNGFTKIDRDIESLEKSLRRVEARLRETSETAARLAKYSDGAGGITNSGDAAKLRALNAAMNESAEDAAKFNREMLQLKSGLAGAGRNTQQTKEQVRALSAAIAAAESDARKYRNEIRAIGIQSGRLKGTMVDAWNAHNASSRTALNLQQRIRGQVLSLIAAYGGLYGVAGAVRQVSEAFMTQEAALSRLGVVFDGNKNRMVVELGWIRREASRLGIEFGVLSDEYTKFAVAGKTSGFSEESIRGIFTSVSEAARVNKLGLEDIQGVYLALSQMISKGKISAEELRQQLGERLPGAMALMAKALGVTTGELDKMMKSGEVLADEDTMNKFAAVLTDQFGSQLPDALRTFTAEWGRLQNTIYNSKLLVGKGGLIDSLTDTMKRINEYANSREGVEFFLALGNAMGDVAAWVPTLMENFENIAKFLKILIAIPIATMFTRWLGSLKLFGGAMITAMTAVRGAPLAFTTMRTSMAAATTTMGAMGIAARGLGAALMTLGPIVAGMAAAGFLFSTMSSWSDGVDQITEAQAQHSRIMDEILSKYDEAKGKTYDWRTAISKKNEAELATQLPETLKAMDAATSRLGDIGLQRDGLSGNLVSDTYKSLFGDVNSADEYVITADILANKFGINDKLVSDLRNNYSVVMRDVNAATREELSALSKSISDFAKAVPDVEIKTRLLDAKKRVDDTIAMGDAASAEITTLRELGQAINDTANIAGRFPVTLSELADGAKEANDALSETDKTIRDNFIKPLEDALNKSSDVKEGIDGLDMGKTVSGPFDEGKTSINEMLSSLGTLKAFMPQLQSAFKQFAQDGSLSKLEKSLEWMKNIPVLSGILDKFLTGAYSDAMGDKLGEYSNFGDVVNSGIGWLIRAKEGKVNTAYADQKEMGGFSHWRVGYGSDTITDPATGKFRTTQQGDTITNAEAEADLARRITGYISDIVSKVGEEQWAALSGDQQEVLLSLAHNYGAVPDKIINAVRTGTKEDVANAIRDEIRPGSVNNERRREEAEIYARGGDTGKGNNPYYDAAKKKSDDAEKAAKAQAEENTAIERSITLEQMRVDGKEREAFIQEKINAYQDKYGQLSAEETARLTEQYGKLYDLQNLKSKDEQTQEKIKKYQEEINRLESERNALLEQREFAQNSGDGEKVKEIDNQLIGVNAKLSSAIDGFIEFWKSSNSPDAAAGIAQLEASKQKLREVKQEAILTAQEVNENVAGGLSDAFSSFAEAIANGDNALAAFRDSFLQFVGEFLVEIGKMIIKQTLLNALQAGGGAGGGFGSGVMGILGSITTGVFHTGKTPGQSGNGVSRSVSPALFANAPRFHNGKLPGLRQGEMAAIIEQDEEVIPTSDPRHAWNQGAPAATAASDGGPTIVNTFDAESFLQAGLSSPAGRKLFMNFVRSNKATIKGALG